MSLPFSQEQIDKFWANVDKTPGLGRGDCWFWKRSRNKGGYGRVNSGQWKGQQLAHRVSYWLTTGSLSEYDVICHKCHCPPCVRPDHIYAGTHATNGRDKAESGRASALKGSLNGNCLFSWQQIDTIRDDFSNKGVSIGKLARRYNCQESVISCIVNNKTWVDVNYQPPPDDGRGQPKLTEEKAQLIREMFLTGGYTFKLLGEKFGVGRIEIGRVVRNQIWVDSTYTPPDDLDERTKANHTFKGEDNPSSKLTWDSVMQIRANFKDGKTSLKNIADEYGVDQTLIAMVIDNTAWKDEGYPPPDRTRIERKIPKDMDAEIYRLYTEEGVKQKDIAARFGVDASKISKIVSRYKKKMG